MAAKPIPEGYASITPYLTVDDGAGAIEFYKRAFGATERGKMAAPDGRIAHAELEIGGSIVMLSDSFPQFLCRAPKELGGTTVGIFLYVEDVDAVVQDAADAGATITMEPEDQFWGTAWAWSPTHMGTCGRSPPTSRTSRPARSRPAAGTCLRA